MFGLSIKEVLSKAIIYACHNCKNTYKSAILENMDKLNVSDEESADALLTSIRREYLTHLELVLLIFHRGFSLFLCHHKYVGMI